MSTDYYVAWWNVENLFDIDDALRRLRARTTQIGDTLWVIGMGNVDSAHVTKLFLRFSHRILGSLFRSSVLMIACSRWVDAAYRRETG